MKYIIWGTGKLYTKYSALLDPEDILCLVDSNPDKQNIQINGKVVCSPNIIMTSEFDYIVVLVADYDSVVMQLASMNVPSEKIITTQDIKKNLTLIPQVIGTNKNFLEWMVDKNNLIFVAIPNFSRTGVPVAAFNIGKLLLRMGYEVCFVGGKSGDLELEFQNESIPYVRSIELYFKDDFFETALSRSKAVIVVSAIMSDFVDEWKKIGTPIVWWLHESDSWCYENRTLPLSDNIFYYGGGKRVIEKVGIINSDIAIKELLYCIPDDSTRFISHGGDKKVFAAIGSINKRKAADIFIEAISKMDRAIVSNCEFYFIGVGDKDFVEHLQQKVCDYPQVHFMGSISLSELDAFYCNIDFLVCVSRDDPMPIVVTEAMKKSIPCIISNMVGQSAFFDDYEFGSVIRNEDVENLVEVLEKFALLTEDQLVAYREASYNVYEQYFTETCMKNNLGSILGEVIHNIN